MAVTFLASTLVAVSGSALLGARWAARGEAVQEAVRTADRLLDSLAALPGAASGSVEKGPLTASWTVGAGVIRVEVAVPPGSTSVVLEGARLPSIPVLPDAGSTEAGTMEPWAGGVP